MFRLWLRTTFELKEDNIFSLGFFFSFVFIVLGLFVLCCFLFFKAKDQTLLLKRQKKRTFYILTCLIFP